MSTIDPTVSTVIDPDITLDPDIVLEADAVSIQPGVVCYRSGQVGPQASREVHEVSRALVGVVSFETPATRWADEHFELRFRVESPDLLPEVERRCEAAGGSGVLEFESGAQRSIGAPSDDAEGHASDEQHEGLAVPVADADDAAPTSGRRKRSR